MIEALYRRRFLLAIIGFGFPLVVLCFATYMKDSTIKVKVWESYDFSGRSSANINRTIMTESCRSPYAAQCGVSKIFQDFEQALEHQASDDKVIILACSLDGGYVDFAVNMHLASISPLRICNILYVALDSDTLQTAKEYNMPVFYYNKDINNDYVGKFRSEAFSEKAKIKLEVTQMALKLGYSVLITDVDVTFRLNPLPFINDGNPYDIAAQENQRLGKNDEIVQFNSGFMFVRSNRKTLLFYEELVKRIPTFVKGGDQPLLNEVYNAKKVAHLTIHPLSTTQFCVGTAMRENPEAEKMCVIFHANFANSFEQKIKKFQRIGMWKMDSRNKEIYRC